MKNHADNLEHPANNWPYRLLTPGPVPLHPEVQTALSQPMIHHRTPKFEKSLQKVLTGLKEIFSTKQPVFMHVSTGSGAMESAIVNTLKSDDEVLVIVSGKFGERWASMCETYSLKTHRLNVEWGNAVSVDKVAEFLNTNPTVRAVFTQACETSTATIHPIKELGALVRGRKDTLLIVDAITAVGAMDLQMDEWGLDVVIGGSQKAFMLPTGLSFIALSEKAWGFNKSANLPKFYFDLAKERKSLESGETHYSSAVNLVLALEQTLDLLTGAARAKTMKRIQSLAHATRDAAAKLGLSTYSKAPSPSVTALSLPAGVDGQKLRAHIEKEYNITVMGGQDQLKGKILRVGHLGYIQNTDMLAFFEALYLSLKEFGVKVSEADLDAALKTFKNEATS